MPVAFYVARNVGPAVDSSAMSDPPVRRDTVTGAARAASPRLLYYLYRILMPNSVAASLRGSESPSASCRYYAQAVTRI